MKLERENADAELAEPEKRDLDHEEMKAVWKRMNGEPRDILYAGEYRQ